MASSHKHNKHSNVPSSKGPAGLVVFGDAADMIEAAKTNPHMAKALTSSGIIGKNKDFRTGLVKEDVDLGPELELWKAAMRFEANREGAEEAFERTFADQLAAIQIEEEQVMRPSSTTSEPKSIAGATTRSGQGSSFAHAHGAGLDKVASRWVRALGEANNARVGQADDQGSGNCAGVAHSSTTAQILHDAVFGDMIPSDPLTREHFGFSKVNSYEEETCLLGLYQGLLLHLPQRPSLETVQGWQQRNKLAGGIYHCYKTQEAESAYFDWFKKNQHFLSQDYTRPEGPWAPMERPTSIDHQKLQATCYPKRGGRRSKS